MSKKNLLNENTVREFMKYANLGGLAENFVSETYGTDEDPMEEAAQVEEGAGSYMEDEEGMEPMADDAPDAEEPIDMDADIADIADEAPSEELPPEAVSALEQAVDDAVEAMAVALRPLGVEIQSSVEDEAPIEADPVSDEAPVDFPDETAPPAPEEDEEIDGVDMLDEEAIVNETMNRVMARLKVMKENKKAQDSRDKAIDSVADSIVARLRAKK